MYRHLTKNNILSGKAFLLLGVYLLHFVLFQNALAGMSVSRDFAAKTFFSDTQRSNVPNSGIAVIRTLEKHESPQQAFTKFSDHAVTISKLFSGALLIHESLDRTHIPLTFHLAETSYRLYLRDCVFRI